MKEQNPNPHQMTVDAYEELSNATADAARSFNEFAAAVAPKTPWDFAKTLPTKARLNYIAEALKYGYSIAILKQELYAFGGMFIWEETPQGSLYCSKMIPV